MRAGSTGVRGILGFGFGVAVISLTGAACGGGSSDAKAAPTLGGASIGGSANSSVAASTSTAALDPCKLLTADDLTPLFGGQVQPGRALTPQFCGLVTSGGSIAAGGVVVSDLGAPVTPGDKIGDPAAAPDGGATIELVKGKSSIGIKIGAGGSATAAQKNDWLRQLAQIAVSRLP